MDYSIGTRLRSQKPKVSTQESSDTSKVSKKSPSKKSPKTSKKPTIMQSSKLTYVYQLSPTPLEYSIARQDSPVVLKKQKKIKKELRDIFDYISDEEVPPPMKKPKVVIPEKKRQLNKTKKTSSVVDKSTEKKPQNLSRSKSKKSTAKTTTGSKRTYVTRKSVTPRGTKNENVKLKEEEEEEEEEDSKKLNDDKDTAVTDPPITSEKPVTDDSAITEIVDISKDEEKDERFTDEEPMLEEEPLPQSNTDNSTTNTTTITNSGVSDPNERIESQNNVQQYAHNYLLGKTPNSSSESEHFSKTSTVVHNVRQVHQCLRHGETLQFRDELQFLLDSMKCGQPLTVRCYSTLNLAQECLKGDFVRQIRSHGLTKKILFQLNDVKSHSCIKVVLGALLYVMISGGITCELDKNCIELFTSLIDKEDNPPLTDQKVLQELEKVEKKTKLLLEKCPSIKVCTERENSMREDEDSNCLLPADLSIGEITVECLINLTENLVSSHWLREELRELGIIDHIANKAISTIVSCSGYASQQQVTDHEVGIQFMKLIRQLKLIENVLFMSKSNQSYLTVFDCSMLVCELSKLLVTLGTELKEEESSLKDLMVECLLGGLRVFLNLTHDNELGSYRIGEQQDLLKALLNFILKLPARIPSENHFDLFVLSLSLLINLIKESSLNQQQLLTISIEDTPDNSTLAMKALIELFLTHYRRVEFADIEVPALQQLTPPSISSSPKSSQVKLEKRTSFFSRLMFKNSSADMLNRLPSKKGNSQELENDIQEQEESDHEEEDKSSSEADEDDTINNPLLFKREDFDTALTKAGHHMEDCIVSSYSAMILAILAKNNSEFATSLKQDLPNGDYSSLVKILNEFLSFMNLAASKSTRSGLDAIRKVLTFLENSQDSHR